VLGVPPAPPVPLLAAPSEQPSPAPSAIKQGNTKATFFVVHHIDMENPPQGLFRLKEAAILD
jgi:hypothetical protein